MAVSCGWRIQALWCNERRSNAWVWIENAGWRKLDDRSDDACTNLLAIAAEAKSRNALVTIKEEMRDDRWVISEIYDFNTGLGHAAHEVSLDVSECIYGWTAAFRQEGTNISVRIRLAPDDDVTAEEIEDLKDRWERGIEAKWSYRFLCCTRPECDHRCALTFVVHWVDEGEHHGVRVRRGPNRTTRRSSNAFVSRSANGCRRTPIPSEVAMATKPGPGSPYVPSADGRRALQAALAGPEPLRDVAITLTTGGGLAEDRYALRFESRGTRDVKCGLAIPGARGRTQLQALQFSDDEAADVRRRLMDLLEADLPVPRIPPDSLVGRLELAVGGERVTIYFMADPGQARDAGHPPPPPLTRVLEAIYAVCARGLGKRWKAP